VVVVVVVVYNGSTKIIHMHNECVQHVCTYLPCFCWACLPRQGKARQGKDIVFRFIIEYKSLRDFGPWVEGLFLYEDF
jgi:hypothetical protein